VFALLKEAVFAGGLVRDVWVTKTACLGLCPKAGTTVALYPHGEIQTEVLPGDCRTLLATATSEPTR